MNVHRPNRLMPKSLTSKHPRTYAHVPIVYAKNTTGNIHHDLVDFGENNNKDFYYQQLENVNKAIHQLSWREMDVIQHHKQSKALLNKTN